MEIPIHAAEPDGTDALSDLVGLLSDTEMDTDNGIVHHPATPPPHSPSPLPMDTSFGSFCHPRGLPRRINDAAATTRSYSCTPGTTHLRDDNIIYSRRERETRRFNGILIHTEETRKEWSNLVEVLRSKQFYTLQDNMIQLLFQEATTVNLHMKLLSQDKIRRRQSKKYRDLQGKIMKYLEQYAGGQKTPNSFLRSCAHLNAPTL